MNGFELQRLDHVSLNVGDRQRSIAWYRDVLGLEQRGEAGRDDQPVFMGEFGACVALFQSQVQSGERSQSRAACATSPSCSDATISAGRRHTCEGRTSSSDPKTMETHIPSTSPTSTAT